MNAWVVFNDGSRGRLVHKSSLVREKLWRKATSNHRARRVQSMCGGVHIVNLKSAAGNMLVEVFCKGDPLSTLVKASGCSLGVVLVTRFVAPGHEVPFSLPQSVAFAAGTIVHADVLQLLPVDGVEEDTRWQCDGRRLANVLCPGLKFPLQSLRQHRAMSVQIRPWPHASPTSRLAPS
jgi:hypothetical protein